MSLSKKGIQVWDNPYIDLSNVPNFDPDDEVSVFDIDRVYPTFKANNAYDIPIFTNIFVQDRFYRT